MKKSFKQNNQSFRSQKQTERNKQNNKSNTEQSKPKGSQQNQNKKNQTIELVKSFNITINSQRQPKIKRKLIHWITELLQLGQIRNALGSWIYLPLFQSYSSFFIVIPTCRFQFFSYGFQIQNLRQSQHLSYINMVSLVEVSSMVLLDVNFNLRQFQLWNKQIHSKSGQ
ncbi:Hypothetical_protein [Hexamita inflata]|uniref:Hypothetical_protein n=1 Tax=Hexamita inflata TaxID=28002 RepID=A0AA86RB24_9EUKA|nr:Hypothetical protein HINF_LOCUS58301 [Hexamita inflata]